MPRITSPTLRRREPPMHGHSFYAEVTLRGEPDPAHGWGRDFGEINLCCPTSASASTHQLLNEIEGLARRPTGESRPLHFSAGENQAAETCRVKLLRRLFGNPACTKKTDMAAAKTPLQLGGNVPIPASPKEAILDAVPNPHPGEAYLVRFTAPEFTTFCPITGSRISPTS
jgi:6-pyruvoyl-tetrahydropterin synthase